MPLIEEGCLVPFSLGAKGDNGLMGKILQAVTSFGFRMCFSGLKEKLLYSVCIVSVWLFLSDVSFLATCLREKSYQNLRASIKLIIFLHKLSLEKKVHFRVTRATTLHFLLALVCVWPCFLMLLHHLRATRTKS